MTLDDYMPFGKYAKGKGNLTIRQVLDEQPEYAAWLLEQDGFAKKNPALAALLETGEDSNVTSTPKERENLDTGKSILASAPYGFKEFWEVKYGERMRKYGELNYVPFMRVALEAFTFALEFNKGPKTTPPPAFQRSAASALSAPLDKSVSESEANNNLDEDVSF